MFVGFWECFTRKSCQHEACFRWNLETLPETNIFAPENRPIPKGKWSLPTFHFQVLCEFEGGYIDARWIRWWFQRCFVVHPDPW